MNVRKIVCVCVFASAVLQAGAQDAALDTLTKKFRQHRETALQEKVYAHLDRTFYLTGEILWFKLYTVDGTLHKPIDVSKVAYVEILDKTDFAVLQAKVELRNGSGNGSFFLPASLASEHYRLRVYTSWMKNFDPEFYFHQSFTIVNPFLTQETAQIKPAKTYSVDFFPEGGNLVAGLESKVGFRISDENGKGAYCKGVILNSQRDTVARFVPSTFGIGNFSFTPSGDDTYRAVLEGPRRVWKEHPFPAIHASGYVLHVKDSGDFLQVTVKCAGAAAADVYLFVHARQIIALAGKQTLRNNRTSFAVRKEELADGISHFTLFNDALQPLCERLYFTYPDKALAIEVESNQKVYNPRKKVTIALQTNAASGEAKAANLSMSVYKVDSLSAGNRMGIYPYLWLGSDLQGTIESPDYYFDRTKKDVEASMDNLMLTHGWRRFDWEDVLGNKPNYAFLPEAREHIVTGVVSKDGKPQRGVFTHLGSPGKIIRAYGSWSNARGQVTFEIKDFYGARRIIVQTDSDSLNSYDIKILNPFSDVFTREKLPVFTLNENLSNEVLSRSIAMQVQDIYYYDEYANRIIQPAIDSSAFYGRADATYNLDDYTRFPVMEEVMREYVPGVFVRKRKDGFHFIVVDYVNGGVLSGSPMVLLDGVPVLDVDDIMSMDPLRIKKLEIVKRQYFLGHSVFSGIVSYTSYNGNMGGMELDPKTLSLNYDGLQLQREFFSPKYTGQQNTDRMPDQRHLLHWQPVITTNEEGKSQVEFYTSDVQGEYVVLVEGLSPDGHAGSRRYSFTVNTPDHP